MMMMLMALSYDVICIGSYTCRGGNKDTVDLYRYIGVKQSIASSLDHIVYIIIIIYRPILCSRLAFSVLHRSTVGDWGSADRYSSPAPRSEAEHQTLARRSGEAFKRSDAIFNILMRHSESCTKELNILVEVRRNYSFRHTLTTLYSLILCTSATDQCFL